MTNDNSPGRYRIEFRFCADLETGMCEFEVTSGTAAEVLRLIADHSDDGLLAVLAQGAVDDFCAFLEYHDEEPDTLLSKNRRII